MRLLEQGRCLAPLCTEDQAGERAVKRGTKAQGKMAPSIHSAALAMTPVRLIRTANSSTKAKGSNAVSRDPSVSARTAASPNARPATAPASRHQTRPAIIWWAKISASAAKQVSAIVKTSPNGIHCAA